MGHILGSGSVCNAVTAVQREVSLELHCKVTLATAVDSTDPNEQAARIGNARPPLDDFANYFVNATHAVAFRSPMNLRE